MSAAECACPGCVANGWEQDCNHSPEYFPFAMAVARAVHGDDADDEQGGWFTDDVKEIAGELRRLIGNDVAPVARALGQIASNPDLHPYVFNDRFVVTLLGTNDGSGEMIADIVADLAEAAS